MSAIIPKKLGGERLKIKGFFTIIDFACVFVFVGVAFFTVWFIPLGLMGKIVIGTFITGFESIFILPMKNGDRLYHFVYYWFKFRTSVKKFNAEDVKNNTSLLVPYKKFIGQTGEMGIIITDPLGMKNKDTSKWSIGAIEIEGFDINILGFEEQEIKISQLRNLYADLDIHTSLVKLERNFEKLSGDSYLNLKINELEKMGLTPKQLESRKEQLKEVLNADDDVYNENLQQKYYLFLYAKSNQELKETTNKLISKAQYTGLTARYLDPYQLINVIAKIFDPLSSDMDVDYIDSYKDKLGELFKFNDVTFNKNNFCTSKNEDEKIYYSVNAIRDYPKFPNRCWMLPFMSTNTTVIVNLAPLQSEFVRKKLNATIMNLKTNSLNISNKNQVEQIEHGQELEIYEEIANQIGRGNEKLVQMNTLMINYADSKKSLDSSNNYWKKELKESGFQVDPLSYKQILGFSSILPKPTDPLESSYSRQVPAITLAEGFPFLSSEINDEKGFKIGEDLMGAPVLLDIFKLNKERKNHNMMILGTSGSGKTTLSKLIMNYQICAGRKVIVIDPEREYQDLCRYHHGNWIDVGNGTNGVINPLQIFLNISNENVDKVSIISNHISFVTGWFEILFPDLDKKVVRAFSSVCAEHYQHWSYGKENILDLEPKEYPTMTDIIDWIEVVIKKGKKENFAAEMELSEILKESFQGFGQYATLYNNHSTVKINSNPFVVFDIHTLFEKGQANVTQAQLYLTTAFISNEVNYNWKNSNNECFVLIDEAHLLVDKDKPIALNFIFQMVKRIRKRRGSMVLVTQNPDDFVGTEEVKKKTTAMLNNVQYTAILNLSSKNIQDVKELYKQYGNGLSNQETEFIARAKTGEVLLMITGYERHTIDIKISKAQMKAFNNEK